VHLDQDEIMSIILTARRADIRQNDASSQAKLLSWEARGLSLAKKHTLKKPTSHNNAQFWFKNHHIYTSSKACLIPNRVLMPADSTMTHTFKYMKSDNRT
jgi:hypothetical protein